MATVKDIFNITKGQKVNSVFEKSQPNSLRYIQIDDLRTNNQLKYTTDTQLVQVNERDIVIAWDGANAGTIGFRINGVIGSTLARLSINKQFLDLCNSDYLGYFLSTKFEYFQNSSTGATIPHINRKSLEELTIPLPDIQTQNKIVAILDKAQGILNKRAKTIQMYDELLHATFLEMFGDPVKNEKGWDMIKLGELGVWKSGGTPSRSNQKYFAGIIPWVTSGELNDLYISSTKEHISQEAIDSSNAKLISSNSLLIGMYDTAALKSSINTTPLACNQAIAYSKIDERKCSVLYVHTAIQIGKEFFKSNQRGVRQQNLNLEMIREISIPNPEINLQHEFVAKYKGLLSYNSKTRTAAKKGELLLNSLSQEVFSERLTIDIDAELGALINAIDLDKKDEENKIDSIKRDLTFIQRLIDKLNEQDFETSDQYEKAKYIAFKIMKEEPDLVKQNFNSSDKKVILEV